MNLLLRCYRHKAKPTVSKTMPDNAKYSYSMLFINISQQTLAVIHFVRSVQKVTFPALLPRSNLQTKDWVEFIYRGESRKRLGRNRHALTEGNHLSERVAGGEHV